MLYTLKSYRGSIVLIRLLSLFYDHNISFIELVMLLNTSIASESISIIKTVPFIIESVVSACDHASSSLKYTSALPVMVAALVFELKAAAISLAFVRGTKLVIL